MLLVFNIIIQIAVVAAMALLGQWLVGLFAGSRKNQNFFYQLLEIIGRPFVILVRWITPRIVLDRHVPLVAFLLLVFVWIITVKMKIDYCLQTGVNLCK